MPLTTAINTLTTTIGKAIGRIEGVLATSDKAQQASLVLGKSLDGTRASLGADLRQLNGTIGQRLQAGIATLNVGLQGNVQGILKLLNEQQLLGQNFKATARTFAKLEATLGFSRSETVSLAEVLVETKEQYAVSTDKLVSVVDSLSKNMPLLKEAGLQKLPEIAAKLAGKVPALQDELKQFFGFFSSASMDTFSKLAILQQPMVREQIAANPGQGEAILENFFKDSAKQIRALTPATKDFVGSFSVATTALGDTAGIILSIADTLEKGREKTSEMNKGLFTEQLKVLKDNFLQPLDSVISQVVFPSLLKIGAALGETFTPVVLGVSESLNIFFQNIFVDGKTFSNTIKKISGIIVVAADLFVTVFNLGASIFQRVYNNLTGITIAAKYIIGAFNILLSVSAFLIRGFTSLVGLLGGGEADRPELNIPELKSFSSILDEQRKNGRNQQTTVDLLSASLGELSQIKDNTTEAIDIPDRPEVPDRLISSLRILDETVAKMMGRAYRDPQLDELIEVNAATAVATTRLLAENPGTPMYASPYLND